MSFAAVSKHLRVLEAAQLVSRGRNAQYRPATLDARPLANACAWIGDYAKFWGASFDAVGDLLAEIATTDASTTDRQRRNLMSNPVSITRTLPATPEQVFDAWTTPAAFAFWFGTAAVPVDDVEMDVRVGGASKAALTAGYTAFFDGMESCSSDVLRGGASGGKARVIASKQGTAERPLPAAESGSNFRRDPECPCQCHRSVWSAPE